MNKHYLLLFVFVAQWLTNFAQSDDRKTWSSMKTLSVPYDIRNKELSKGNLVKNPSFEKGELINGGKLTDKDTLLYNFKLDSWTKVGENVEWVDANNSYYKKDEVLTGNHSIKIKRGFADVKEFNNTPDGIESDFIEVIPGNYNFNIQTRMERVFPAVQRYTSKLSRDIDIRLSFFDENKKLMSPGIPYEYYGKDVDNSFKGFAFSNFYYIDKFDWGIVNCRTYNYPFSEGDLPDGCKYVKISIGLLGRGTMYIDDVDFQYSTWNFTSLEKVQKYFEKEYTNVDLLIPTPQKVTKGEPISFKSQKAYVIIPENPANSDKSALELITKHFGKQLIVLSDNENIKADQIVFSIGKTKLYQKNSVKIDMKEIKDLDEGYVIKKVDNIIFLVGNEIKGDYLATTTLVQLFEKDTKIYYHADIVDFPDFKGRSYLFTGYVNKWTLDQDTSLTEDQRKAKYDEGMKNLQREFELIDYYASFKLNKVYNNYGSLTNRWWIQGEYHQKLFEGAGKICNKLGTINTCIMINPYAHFDYEAEEGTLSDSLRNIFSHSKAEDIKKITDLIDVGIKNGAKTVMICADDFVPHAGTTRGQYALFTDADKAKYPNIAAAQSDMMNKIINKYDKSTRFEFCPAPYLNEFIDYGMGSAEAFFRDLTANCPKNMAIVWTGNTVRSLAYDMADIRRYTDLIGRKPMLWDNTPYARESGSRYGGFPALYPGKTVMCSLFEPYDIIVPKDFHNYIDDIYSNGGGISERYKIKYPTFADFAWNNNAYDPNFSLYKTLVWLYGKDNAMKLLVFSDNYYKLVSITSEITTAKQISKDSKVYEPTKEQLAEGGKYKIQLEENVKQLKKTLKNERLFKDVEDLKNGSIQNYDNIIKSGNTGEIKKGHRQT